jgi:DNA helicase-2/ATP-dependent DNA helicase PcrA
MLEPNNLDTLNLSEEQREVVNNRGADLQVIACAGSGKTESISRRVAALIAEGEEPASIIAFTFTERAAAEIKDRITRRVGELMGREFLDRLGPMYVGTIHGYCLRLLQEHVPEFGNHDVLDEHRHAGFLSRHYRDLGLSKLGSRHWRPIQEFTRAVDVIGNELIPAERLAGTDLGDCYVAYRDALERYHLLTFGLIIASAIEQLERPEVFARVHSPLRHLIVDEYQDINPAQERLIELLALPPVQLCVVGDDDQAIYQWRGSDVRNILEFARRRQGARQVVLNVNRRSRPTIVETAATFADTIPNRLPKRMAAARDGGAVEFVPWAAETETDEAETIASTIARLAREGYRYRDIAILFRSVRTSAPILIAALRDRGIPFACGGRTGLFLQPEVALFGEAFVWLADGDWQDEAYGEFRPACVEHIVAGLNECFGGENGIPGLKKYLEDWKSFLRNGNRPVNLVGDFYKLLNRLRAHEIDLNTPEGAARLGALARFSQMLADYEHVNRRGRYVEGGEGGRTFRGGQDRGSYYLQGLANYLVHYARDAYEDFEGEPTADLDAVDILTVHQAKGLEWPIVFMPALVEGRFPSRRTGQAQEWLLPDDVFPAHTRVRYEGSEAEERRLFYVAMTRARDTLYLSCFQRKKRNFKPSRFLEELAGSDLPLLSDLPSPDHPADERPREAPPIEVSFSDVANYDTCGHRYRLGSILGFQQELAVELGYGRAIHHVLRAVAERAREGGGIPTPEELRQMVEGLFYVPFANAPAFERMHRAAQTMVRRYVADYQDDLHRIWATERPFALHVEDGIVNGRADVILNHVDGQVDSLAIVDYKLSDDPRSRDRYELQLAVYAAAGRGEGLDVAAAYLHELDEGTRGGVDVGEGASAAAVERVSGLMRGIRLGEYVPKPDPQGCQRCDFQQVCAHCSRSGRDGWDAV